MKNLTTDKAIEIISKANRIKRMVEEIAEELDFISKKYHGVRAKCLIVSETLNEIKKNGTSGERKLTGTKKIK